MSDYYLADQRAKERALQREARPEPRKAQAQEVKVQMLGDFVSASTEPTGSDPYNSTHGKAVRDAWQARRQRR
ncbi:MAG: hypothetical protein H7Y89_20780 [Steroidobacteraceae bacterium]|nr:hypothetical protein [Steroidobacteraceae bacterium]